MLLFLQERLLILLSREKKGRQTMEANNAQIYWTAMLKKAAIISTSTY